LLFLFVAGFGACGFYFFGFREHSIKATVLAHGPLAGIFFHLGFGEPAAVGEVGGGFRERRAVADAVLLEHIFGGGPLGLEGVVGAAVGFARADPVAFFVHGVVVDGFLGGCGLVGFFHAGQTGQGEDGDFGGGECETAVDGVELVIERAGHDFGTHEPDGGVVLKEGHDDVAGFGEFAGTALEVGDAVVEALHGGLAALDAVDFEGAAAAWCGHVGVVGIEGCFWFLGFGCCLCCVRHRYFPFVLALSQVRYPLAPIEFWSAANATDSPPRRVLAWRRQRSAPEGPFDYARIEFLASLDGSLAALRSG
jgi:hypothetical protein